MCCHILHEIQYKSFPYILSLPALRNWVANAISPPIQHNQSHSLRFVPRDPRTYLEDTFPKYPQE